MEEMNNWLPYVTAVAAALISGLCSYAAARKQSTSGIQALKEANGHELEKLMRQHEVDLDSLRAAHALEMEKLEVRHRHEMEMANYRMQNEIASSLMNSLCEGVLGASGVKEVMGEVVADYIKNSVKPS